MHDGSWAGQINKGRTFHPSFRRLQQGRSLDLEHRFRRPTPFHTLLFDLEMNTSMHLRVTDTPLNRILCFSVSKIGDFSISISKKDILMRWKNGGARHMWHGTQCEIFSAEKASRWTL